MKANPLSFLLEGTTIFADCARVRWRGATAKPLSLVGQEANGSWANSVYETITNLYPASLVTAQLDESTRKSLSWLLELHHEPMQHNSSDGCPYSYLFFRTSRYDNKKLLKIKTMPFTPGCSGFVKTGAALYLAVHFGLQDHPRVQQAFETVEQVAAYRHGRFCSGSCGNNLLQAMAIHPIVSKSKAMDHAIDYLNRQQDSDGSWSHGIPFLPTFYALSRLDQPLAVAQFDKAFAKLLKLQNRDGSWGRTDKEFRTLLVVDALMRKQLPLE